MLFGPAVDPLRTEGKHRKKKKDKVRNSKERHAGSCRPGTPDFTRVFSSEIDFRACGCYYLYKDSYY